MQKTRPVGNTQILHDLIKYSLLFFIPLFLFGLVYGAIYDFSFMVLIGNPVSYSVGISLVIVIIQNDIDDILALFGFGKEPRLELSVKYSKEIQEIGVLMGTTQFPTALEKVNILLQQEPKLTEAHNLKGEILLRGFKRMEEARKCFDRALQLSDSGDEQHRLAKALKAATFR